MIINNVISCKITVLFVKKITLLQNSWNELTDQWLGTTTFKFSINEDDLFVHFIQYF
jgi:hypothetical protein